MSLYEKLDVIADLYNPAILILMILSLILMAKRCDYDNLRRYTIFFLSAMILTYGLMYIDNIAKLWSFFGLDYSTHTACAVCVVAILAYYWKRYSVPIVSSLILYCGLMLYQQYHSIADIVTTAIVVGSALIISKLVIFGRKSGHD